MIGTYSIITAEIRAANISDYAFRVYAEIYALNYTGIKYITDRTLSNLTRRSIVSTNRAVNELKKAGIIKITMVDNKRVLTSTARNADTVVLPGYDAKAPYEPKNEEVPPVLRAFLDEIRRK